MVEEIKTLPTDDLNIKEMCNTFNPEALAIDNNKLEENNKIEWFIYIIDKDILIYIYIFRIIPMF